MTNSPLVDFKATYRTPSGELDMNLMARSLSHATLSASELLPEGCQLLRVVRTGQW